MDRPDDILIPPGTRWLSDPAAKAVCDAITAGGHNIYFVGGCVRNALLGEADSDVDLSTDALPEQVMALAKAAGLKPVPTGIDHGTVTVVSDGTGFEVTTFRRDVETDGRRAVVAFSDDIADDARRRDFTMNALYATPEGRVIDPLNGLTDLLARRLRFIEDASVRIREDYLRILRFFRFSAWYTPAGQGFEADSLAAIGANTGGLETLSAERIGQEMRKLLAAPDPAPALAAMRQTGVLPLILPGSDARFIGPMAHVESLCGIATDWRSRLALLGGEDLQDRLRLSKVDARDVALLQQLGFAGPPLNEVAYHEGEAVARQVLAMRHAISGQPPDLAKLETLSHAAKATFPIAAKDLMPDYKGADLGARLKHLESAWIASGFTLSYEDLMKLP